MASRARLILLLLVAWLVACGDDARVLSPRPDGGAPGDGEDGMDVEPEPGPEPDAGPYEPELSLVQTCVGERTPCHELDAVHCAGQGCNFARCQGGFTDCWDATHSGSDLALCEELSAYCHVATVFIPACQANPTNGSIPCSVFDDLGGSSNCRQAGCTWTDAPSCSGEVVQCHDLSPSQCHDAQGCRLIEQRQAPCYQDGCVCPDDSTLCLGYCIDTRTSTRHCGACGNFCAEGTACVDGACVDEDECELGRYRCPTDTVCRNTEPGYACDCHPGYAGDPCADIDECSAAESPCDEHANCYNTRGSFQCYCAYGYEGDGLTCTEIDECAGNPCGFGTCTDALLGYTCECDPGYVFLGSSCQLQNGCLAAGLVCDPYAGCYQQADFSYACECSPGFEGDGLTCLDIDECATPDRCGINTVCTNEPGSFLCTCAPGWSHTSGGCTNVTNRCLAEQGCPSEAQCVTTATNFVCACDEAGAPERCGSWLSLDWQNVSTTVRNGTGYWFVAPRALRLMVTQTRNDRFDETSLHFVGNKTYSIYAIPRDPTGTMEVMADMELLGTCNSFDEEPCFPDLVIPEGTRVGVIAATFHTASDRWLGIQSSSMAAPFEVDGMRVDPRPLSWSLGPLRQGREAIEGLEVYATSSRPLGAVGLMWRLE